MSDDFEEFNFFAIFYTINRTLQYMIMSNISLSVIFC